ncbi:MAG: amidohydrolase family protein [Alphaproteobacteria bacterium]|nr:amidohydrolase family protein [Alphaproteobacteria bacterium]
MAQTLFTNVEIFDGTGKKPYPGEVLVQGNRIKRVAKGSDQIAREGARVIDGQGATVLPGLVEAHAHITYSDAPTLKSMGDIPPEEHTLLTARNAKLMLDMGFTSLFSAASAKPRLEIAVRNWINEGKLPGPRLKAASPEIVATGGLGDERQLHMYHTSIEIIADGPIEVRRVCREMIREGVDTIKVNISGDNFTATCRAEMLSYAEDEIAAAAEVAHSRGVNLACHARADAAVRMALKHGYNVIYHCDFATEETIDLLEAKKKEIFLAPAAGAIYATCYEAGDWGITPEVADKVMDLPRKMENTARVYREIRKRGIRALPGGDYGFAWTPMGTNARDLEHFVNLFGYEPQEAIMAATKWGGELMGMGDELGLVKAGYLADLIMVDGDPCQDITLFQDQQNILMVMKNGEFHRAPQPRRRAARRAKAAE